VIARKNTITVTIKPCNVATTVTGMTLLAPTLGYHLLKNPRQKGKSHKSL
jgi:hypothetical protein